MSPAVKRVLVSLIFIPIILLVLFNGGYFLLSFIALLTLLATCELYKILAKRYPALPKAIIPLNVLYFIGFSVYGDSTFLFASVITVICTIGVDIFQNRTENSVMKFALSLFVMVYIAYFLSFAYRIDKLESGNYLLIFIMIATWLTDTFAYFIGIAFGKHRNIFKASPKKSIEGFIAGFLAAIISSVIICVVFKEHCTVIQGLIIGVSVGIFGQFGDLIESTIKRDVDVKDSSSAIPGHGGVLDRFDSLIFSLPLFYLLNYIATKVFIG